MWCWTVALVGEEGMRAYFRVLWWVGRMVGIGRVGGSRWF